MATVTSLIAGYGPNFPSLEQLLTVEPTEKDTKLLNAPTPFGGRYYDDTSFLENITSQRTIALLRFKVIIGKYLALSDALTEYSGKHADRKIVHLLTDEDKQALRELATAPADALRAQLIEGFTEHDTAAAGDYLKILIGTRLPHLEPMIEGIVFGDTSEDTMSLVFGLIGNKLVLGEFLPRLLRFMLALVKYVQFIEQDGPLVMVGLTHMQAAEPTTFGRRIASTLGSINDHLDRMRWHNRFIPFSGKWSGAIGNSTTHLAAYPDLDWAFRDNFVEDVLGLTLDRLPFQASTYTTEASHFGELANIASHLIKMLEDFARLCSCPGQQFVKRKVKGTKGSSIMPNKTNLWAIEGAIVMLQEFIALMRFLSSALINYPHEGNMGRSYLFRSLGRYFEPAFCALNRIEREMIGDMETRGCVPNQTTIDAILDTYPGIAGSSIQTILKREGIEGDAYREIEGISINSDGSYANAAQFASGLEEVIARNNLSAEVADELRAVVNPAHNYGYADTHGKAAMGDAVRYLQHYLKQLEPYQAPLV